MCIINVIIVVVDLQSGINSTAKKSNERMIGLLVLAHITVVGPTEHMFHRLLDLLE